MGPPPSPPTGSPIPSSSWLTLTDGAPPHGERRGRGRPGHRRAGRPVASATRPPCSRPSRVPSRSSVWRRTARPTASAASPTSPSTPTPPSGCSPAAPTRVTGVLVRAADGISAEQLAARISADAARRRSRRSPAPSSPPSSRRDVESDFLGFFQTLLLAFAGIAIVVAAFSIHNTFSILVAQRTRESALMRADRCVAPPGRR